MISQTVLQIGEIHFEGNVIPHAWYRTPLLRFVNGKVNKVAMDLLADLVYWYRPVIVRDEKNNSITELRQKFRGDKYQIYYQKWADFFGYTHRQVKDAISFLRVNGLITVELRTVEVEGMRWGNVPFLEPVPEKVRQISSPVNFLDEGNGQSGSPSHAVTSEEGSHVTACEGTRSNVRTRTLERAHTEITPEISTENLHTPPPRQASPTRLNNSSKRKARRSYVRRVCEKSKYSVVECLKYVKHQKGIGRKIDNPEGLAFKLYETGSADPLIEEFLHSQVGVVDAPPSLKTEPINSIITSSRKHSTDCACCFGTGMEVVPGKGARRCTYNEVVNGRGQSVTG